MRYLRGEGKGISGSRYEEEIFLVLDLRHGSRFADQFAGTDGRVLQGFGDVQRSLNTRRVVVMVGGGVTGGGSAATGRDGSTGAVVFGWGIAVGVVGEASENGGG